MRRMNFKASKTTLVLVLGVCLLTACKQQAAAVASETIRPVKTITVGEASSQHSTSFSAEIKPRIESQLAFRVGGKVVERMVAPAGSSDFSRLSVMLQARYDMEQVLEVPPEAFDPQPRVNSAVVRMIPRQDFSLNSAQWNSLEKVVAAAFSQRRKMLRTNLQSFSDRLKLSEIELKSRAQDISVDRYIEWAKILAA